LTILLACHPNLPVIHLEDIMPARKSTRLQTSKRSEPVIEDPIHRPKNLIQIAILANATAWVMLAITALTFIDDLSNYLNDLFRYTYLDFINFTMLPDYFNLISIMVGLGFFVILRAICEGIYLWMDIELSLREARASDK
jgi:hypothetical protein